MNNVPSGMTKEEFETRKARARDNEERRGNNQPHYCVECIADHNQLSDCKRQDTYEYGRYI